MSEDKSDSEWKAGDSKKEEPSAEDVEFVIGYAISGAGTGDEVYGWGGRGSVAKTVTRPIEEVKAEWARIMEKIAALIDTTSRANAASQFQLDEVEMGLGFSAKGHLAFIAEAGVDATIKLTFKRKP